MRLFFHLGVTVLVVFVTLGRRRIDYRVVMAGALLPDLIDEVLRLLSIFGSDQGRRLAGHTLLFTVALLLSIQGFLRGAAARRWFVLPIAASIHLALDGMWSYPMTLFWPLFGARFGAGPAMASWAEVVLHPAAHPGAFFAEAAGLGVLIYTGYSFGLFRRDRLREFLRTGVL